MSWIPVQRVEDFGAMLGFMGIMVPPSGPVLVLENATERAMGHGVVVARFGEPDATKSRSVLLAHKEGSLAPEGTVLNHRAIGMAASFGLELELRGPHIFLLLNPSTPHMLLSGIGARNSAPENEKYLQQCVENGWEFIKFPSFVQWINAPAWHRWTLEGNP